MDNRFLYCYSGGNVHTYNCDESQNFQAIDIIIM